MVVIAAGACIHRLARALAKERRLPKPLLFTKIALRITLNALLILVALLISLKVAIGVLCRIWLILRFIV